MSTWPIWLAVLLVPASVAFLVTACIRRCGGSGLHPLGLGSGYVAGFWALRVVRSALAAAGQPQSHFLDWIRTETGKIAAPTTVSDWLPLQCLALACWACGWGVFSGRQVRRVFWLLATATLIGSLAWQFRKTRYLSLPNAESLPQLLPAVLLLLVGWLALTGRIGWVPPRTDRRDDEPGRGPAAAAHRVVARRFWLLAIVGGGVLSGLLSLSGSLTLGIEAWLLPAALVGTGLGSIERTTRISQQAVRPVANDLSWWLLWSGLSLIYLMQGMLLAKLTTISAALWLAAAAWAIGAGQPLRLETSWRGGWIAVMPSLVLWGVAGGLAARQFWLDVH